MAEEATFVLDHEIAPEPPPKGPIVWARTNLFPTVSSSILTLAAGGVTIAFLRGMLGFALNDRRRWDAVTTNMRLYMVRAYPPEDFHRVWISVGLVLALVALSVAAWGGRGKTSVARISRSLMIAGGVLLLATVVAPGLLEPSTGRIIALAIGAALMAAGYLWPRTTGDRGMEEAIPSMTVVGVLMALILALVWTIELPVLETVSATGMAPIGSGTRWGWTLVFLAVAGAYLVGGRLRIIVGEGRLKSWLLAGWVVIFPLLVLWILRKPGIDWSEVVTRDLPIMLAFSVVGGAILAWMSRPSTGEIGRIAAGILLVVGIASFFVSMTFLYRGLLLFFGIFALAAPTFGGAARTKLLAAWSVSVVAIVFLFRLAIAATSLDMHGSYLGGLTLTFTLAIFGIALSFPLGILLALGRTSSMPIFRMLSTGYIELVRSVPLITWLFFGSVLLALFLPPQVTIDEIVRAIAAIAIFSAAYLAENVRGGLQSIPKGQYEAAKAVGMSTVQMTALITLPQALKAVLPALVGQIISLFKDTSLVAIVGLFDFLRIGNSVVPNQSTFLGIKLENLLFVAIVYWMFTFAFSRASMRLERRLGLGQR